MLDAQNVPPELAATVAQLTIAGVVPSPRKTIAPPLPEALAKTESAEEVHASSGFGPLPYITLVGKGERECGEGDKTHADLEITGLLGEGGMGRVDLAVQRAFGRTVAVKRVRGEQLDVRSVLALIREARTTGRLDHPNIVPAHALGRTRRGDPLLVMKRVVGVTWTKLIHEEAHPAWGTLAGDRLANHLQILMHVCNAVEFAHRHNVVHRDLKPDNVMVGDLGEVYVLDWGIAVRLDEPRSKDLAGTPAYMAPEMLRGSVAVTPRTDVYLLGAMLHEVLVREPRHAASSLVMVMVAADQSAPYKYDASVTRELAELCNRATAKDPADRFATALEFRDAIASFVEHRGSLDLSAQGEQTLVALRDAVAAAAAGSDALHTEVRRLAAEVDFAFRQALRIWPENTAAQEGLQRALVVMIGFELTQRNAPSAEAMLSRLTEPHPELTARLEALQSELRTEAEARAKLERLRHEQDPNVSSRARAVGAAFSFGGFGAVFFALAAVGFRLTHGGLAAIFACAIVSFVPAVYRDHTSLLKTRYNRRIQIGIVSTNIVGFLLTLLGWASGASVDVVLLVYLGAFFMANVAAALWADPSMLVLAAALGVPAVLCAFWPGHGLVVLGVEMLCLLLGSVVRYLLHGEQTS